MVLAAGQSRAADARVALAALCETYWYPLYAYLRRRGLSAEESQDVTQSFFAHLLESEAVKVADPQRGKFRSFLLSSLSNFLANHWRKEQAQKRGGDKAVLSLDLASGEQRYLAEPSHDLTPERIFERRWALTVLDEVLAGLKQEYEDAGKATLFDHLKPYLGGSTDGLPYAELAQQIGMTEGAIKVSVHRLRRRCGELLRQRILHTVADPSEVDDELRHLYGSLGS
jgi:RNA polymerase sigma-70 factor (ECF subfamily)